MKSMLRRMTASLLVAASVIGGCSSLSGGPSKVVVNEGICSNVRFLNMKLNTTNRVILDNKKHSEGQSGMSLTLTQFPVVVKGPVPPGSLIGDQLSTIVLGAKAGDQSSVDLVPTFTGTFKAKCVVAITQGSGSQANQHEIAFQIK